MLTQPEPRSRVAAREGSRLASPSRLVAWTLALAALALLAWGCADDPDAGPDDADAPGDAADADVGDAPRDTAGGGDAPDEDAPDSAAPEVDHLQRLAGPGDLAALQSEAGSDVKYTLQATGAPVTAPVTAACYFQNMRRYPWHVQFLRSLPGGGWLDNRAYEAMAINAETRVWWTGALQAWPLVRHPVSGASGVFTFIVYAMTEDAQAPLTVAQLVEVRERLVGCAPFVDASLVFVPADPAQRAFVAGSVEALAAAGVAWLYPEALIAGQASVTYSEGEGYGTLRIIEGGARLEGEGPREVIVMQSAPNDISLVAGLITADPQNLHSHVNLRLQEKGVPNAAVPAVMASDYMRALEGGLVHVVADGAGVRVEAARLEDAERFWAIRQPALETPEAALDVRAPTPYAGLAEAGGTAAFGAKAANLAVLRGLLPPEHRVEGLGVPFARYQEHLEAAGIDDALAATLANPRLRTDATWREAALDALRDRIEAAPLVEGFEQALHAELRAVFGDGVEGRRVRFRSSTNAEDLDVISGAGLYSSHSGCLGDDLDGDARGPSRCLGAEERAWLEATLAARRAELAAHPERAPWLQEIIDELERDLTREKTVARAVRRVWASLWSARAFAEREHYGLDHARVYMGLAVNLAFTMEQANAVLVTNLAPGEAGPTYRVVSQVGEESVVRPADPTAVAEVLVFERGAGDAVVGAEVRVPSSRSPEGAPIWSEAELEVLAGLAFVVQDHFAAAVYPTLDPLRLDLEVKRDRDGRVVIKQVRPYLSVEP